MIVAEPGFDLDALLSPKQPIQRRKFQGGGTHMLVWPPFPTLSPSPKARKLRKKRIVVPVFPLKPVAPRVRKRPEGRRMVFNPDMPPLDPEDAEMMACLRREARSCITNGIPSWMEFEDLIHAGWLGYTHGWYCADPSKGDPRNYAKANAVGAMKAEIMQFFGAGRKRPDDGITLRWSDLRDLMYGSSDEPGHAPYDTEARERWENSTDEYLKRLLRPLTRDRRFALYLRYMRNYKVTEVAHVMRITNSKAQHLIKQGLFDLRLALRP